MSLFSPTKRCGLDQRGILYDWSSLFLSKYNTFTFFKHVKHLQKKMLETFRNMLKCIMPRLSCVAEFASNGGYDGTLL